MWLSERSSPVAPCSPGTRVTKPRIPWLPGGRPVPSVARLTGVVLGQGAERSPTGVSSAARVGARPAWARTRSAPSPSTRSTATRRTPSSAAVRPSGSAGRFPRSTGTPSAVATPGRTSASVAMPYGGTARSGGSGVTAVRRAGAARWRRRGRARPPPDPRAGGSGPPGEQVHPAGDGGVGRGLREGELQGPDGVRIGAGGCIEQVGDDGDAPPGAGLQAGALDQGQEIGGVEAPPRGTGPPGRGIPVLHQCERLDRVAAEGSGQDGAGAVDRRDAHLAAVAEGTGDLAEGGRRVVDDLEHGVTEDRKSTR